MPDDPLETREETRVRRGAGDTPPDGAMDRPGPGEPPDEPMTNEPVAVPADEPGVGLTPAPDESIEGNRGM